MEGSFKLPGMGMDECRGTEPPVDASICDDIAVFCDASAVVLAAACACARAVAPVNGIIPVPVCIIDKVVAILRM